MVPVPIMRRFTIDSLTSFFFFIFYVACLTVTILLLLPCPDTIVLCFSLRNCDLWIRRIPYTVLFSVQ